MPRTAITLAALAAAVFRSPCTYLGRQRNDQTPPWPVASTTTQYDDEVSWADLEDQPPGYW